MKILIFILVLIPFKSFSQNFMMTVNTQEIYEDTTIYHYNTKMIWGIKDKKICFLWENYYPLCFIERNNKLIVPKKMKKKMDKIIKLLEFEVREAYIKVRKIYYNQWNKIFLITIYINEGVMIQITRLDDKFPHYLFYNKQLKN